MWAKQPEEFFEQAIIDMDGHLVGTDGECKKEMDIGYNGTWGYHPLIVSLANTKEVLSIVNRPGNRPSHEGAAGECDRAIDLCRRGGFRKILLRTQPKQALATQLSACTSSRIQRRCWSMHGRKGFNSRI